jgi:hypothetical protein
MVMKKMSTGFRPGMFFAGLLIVAESASAVIVDSNPAPFRGRPNTTIQAWDFLTNANPIAPEAGWVNPFGAPSAQRVSPYSPEWLSEDYGHKGVWVLDRSIMSDMIISVPNSPQSDPSIELWMQIVYSSEDGRAPMIYVLPNGDDIQYAPMTRIKTQSIDNYYNYALYSLTVKPSFKFCVIYVRPSGCSVYVDSVIVETLTPGVVLTPDIDGDGSVEIDDLILLAEQWTRSDCSGLPESKWCSGADLNQDGAVNLDDLATLAASWLTDTP